MLRREENQSVIIADCIKVTFLGVEDGRAILGFDAPKDISVQREEVYFKSIAANGLEKLKNLFLKSKNEKENIKMKLSTINEKKWGDQDNSNEDA